MAPTPALPPKLKDPHVLRVFISSPFRGMQREREILSKMYWPQVESLLAARGLHFSTVDMRWGITTESSDDSQVVNICLRELSRSDFFIGSFGQRYGWHGRTDGSLQQNFDKALVLFPWVDALRDRSVTELEFFHGFLNNPGHMPACFCFRDKSYDDARRVEAGDDQRTASGFTSESSASRERIEDLKLRVVRHQDKAKGVLIDYKSPKEAAEFMFTSVMRYLEEDLLVNETPPTQREVTYAAHQAYMRSRQGLYVGGEKYYGQLDDYVNKRDEKEVLVITGEAGSGKSALLSNWIQWMTSQTSNQTVIYHFVGSELGSTKEPNLLRRLIDEIKYLYSLDAQKDGEKSEKEETDKKKAEDEGTTKKESPQKQNEKDVNKSDPKTLTRVSGQPLKEDKGSKGDDQDQVGTGGKDEKVEGKKDDGPESKDSKSQSDPDNKEKNKKVKQDTENRDGKHRKIAREFLEIIGQISPGDENISPAYKDNKISQGDNENKISLGHKVNKPLILVIDGLDKLDPPGKIGRPLFWIPKRLPSHVSIVMSTSATSTQVSEDTMEILKEQLQARFIHLQPLSPDEKHLVCKALLDEHSKSLSPDQLSMIIDSDRTAHPLFLRTLIDELCVSGQFRQLSDQIESLLVAEGVVGLLDKIFDRLEVDYAHPDFEGNVLEKVLSAIYLCKEGLTEAEIPLPRHVWANLHYALIKLLINRSGHLTFAFEDLAKVVCQRYIKGDDHRKKVAREVADIFYKPFKESLAQDKPPPKRSVFELSHLLHVSGDMRALQDVISDAEVFNIFYDANAVYELLEYWKSCGVPDDAIARRYIRSCDVHTCKRYVIALDDYDDTKRQKVVGWARLTLEKMRSWFSYCRFMRGSGIIIPRVIDCVGRRTDITEEKKREQLNDLKYQLACHYNDMELFQESLDLHLKVMEERTRLVEEGLMTQTELGMCYHAVGLAYGSLRDDNTSETWYNKSLEIQRAQPNSGTFPSDTLTNLGLINHRRGEWQKAIECYRECIQIHEDNHPGEVETSMAYVYHNWGYACRCMGDLDEAEKLYQKSLKVKERIMGRESIDVSVSLMNLGTLELRRKNLEKSLEYFRECLEITYVTAPPGGSMITKAEENLALTLVKNDRYEEAEKYYLRALKWLVERDKFGDGLPFLHRTFCQWYIDKGKYAEAMPIAEQLVKGPKAKEKDFALLHVIDSSLDAKSRPVRSREMTIDFALQKWPVSNILLTVKVDPFVDDANDLEGVRSFLKTHVATLPADISPASLYKEVATILQDDYDKLDMARDILEDAVRDYGDDSTLRTALEKLKTKEDERSSEKVEPQAKVDGETGSVVDATPPNEGEPRAKVDVTPPNEGEPRAKVDVNLQKNEPQVDGPPPQEVVT